MRITEVAIKVDSLEKNLLAICSLNDMCQEALRDSNGQMNFEPCAYLLGHLIEPAMYLIEEIRLRLGEFAARENQLQSEVGECS